MGYILNSAGVQIPVNVIIGFNNDYLTPSGSGVNWQDYSRSLKQNLPENFNSIIVSDAYIQGAFSELSLFTGCNYSSNRNWRGLGLWRSTGSDANFAYGIDATQQSGFFSRSTSDYIAFIFDPAATEFKLSVISNSTTLPGASNARVVGLRNEILGHVNLYDLVPQDNDPYGAGGESVTGGGTGSFDGTGDNVDIPGLPTLSATSTGFITLFNPSITQLNELSNYMWSNGFDLETFKKLFANPMDCILGLSIVPVAVPNGETSTVSVGNISTGVSMTKAASQYVTVDCGTLIVNEYWGAYLDYDPYTKAEIYLPYIGTHALSVDDIMGKSVHVVYHVDILSGACAAYVKCGGSVLYTFIGQCSSSIPITGNDWTNVINGVLSIAGAVGSMVATGGASAPMAAGMIASTAVNGLKPNVEKSGSMSGTGGMLGIQTPYLILTRPRQALPKRQNTFTGYPSFITSKLDSLSGYTEIEEIHLENIPGTEQELSEIENLLKRGVII